MEPLVRLISVFTPMSLASFPTISIPRRSKHYSINSDYLEAFCLDRIRRWVAMRVDAKEAQAVPQAVPMQL
jgi:hypothetical protein